MSKEGEDTKYFVVEVIPIIRGLPKATLSYFTREEVQVGSFVKISVRSSKGYGLVTKVTLASIIKSDLKSSTFALKRLEPIDRNISFSEEFISAVNKTAKFYASSVGGILNSVIPKILLESPELMGEHFETRYSKASTCEPLLIQLPDDERYREYTSIVRGVFARSKSVLFIAPTHEDALRAFDILSNGIREYAYTTARKSPNAIKEVLNKIRKQKHPILLITTPSFICIDRKDMETIILEKENSRFFKTLKRPFIDLRTFIEYLCNETGKTLILGDSLLSIESLWLEKQGMYAELSPLKWKINHSSKVSLVDMKSKLKENFEENKSFRIFSKELIEILEKGVKEKRKVFLFGSRKGLSPSTICKDCGSLLACQNCKAPVVLHENPKKEPYYLCHACGTSRSAETRCDNCESWNLVPIGIGIDRIAKEVRKMFPASTITVFDKEHAPTPKKATMIAKQLGNEKGGIIVGTELALLYIEKVPYVGVVSLDSLFAIPDFSINERIFYLVGRILEKCELEAIVQTRNIGQEVLTHVTKGDILAFYRSEIKEREELHYPPFYLFIKVSTEGTTNELEKKVDFLKNLFSSYSPDFIKSRGMKTGRILVSMIIRVYAMDWPEEELIRKLLLLPNDFLIKVDPESI